MGGQQVRSRVIRGTKEQELGTGRACLENLLRAEVELLVQGHLADRRAVDVGLHLVHAVSRRAGDDLVFAGDAEQPEQQVYGLVAAIAEEDIAGSQPFKGSDFILEGRLARIWIAVQGIAVEVGGIFIGVQHDRSRAFEFAPGRTVGLQLTDIGAKQATWVGD